MESTCVISQKKKMLLMVTSSVFQKIMGKNHQNAFSIQRIIESCHFVQRHAKIGSWYNKYRFKLESIFRPYTEIFIYHYNGIASRVFLSLNSAQGLSVTKLFADEVEKIPKSFDHLLSVDYQLSKRCLKACPSLNPSHTYNYF